MSQALAPDFGLDDLDAAFIAYDAAVLHPLVFAADAFPVLYRPENLCAKKSVPFRLESTVIYRFRFFYFAI